MKTGRTMWLLCAILSTVLAVAGLTYAWFSYDSAMSTLISITPPDFITISPVSGEYLDLDFQEGVDEKDELGFIHIRRFICVKSTNQFHDLEVVHTTNLANLSFKIFPVTAKQGDQCSYDPNSPVSPVQKINPHNPNDPKDHLAKEDILDNYDDLADVADVHAFPLYWLIQSEALKGAYFEKTQEADFKNEQRDFFSTYYCLEISWKETSKETDLFYIIAQNKIGDI